MKKFILTLCFLVLFNTAAFASCDYSEYCPQGAYDLSPRGCQVFSQITGMNFLAEQVAQTIIKKEIKKATKENFRVEMKSYSPSDLLHGRFKSLNISGRNLEVEGAYITALNVKTICDFNYIELNKKSIKFKENMVMAFDMEMTGSDLKKTVNSIGYLDMLNHTNLSAFGITFFKLSGADVDIKNNKIYFTIKVTTPMSSQPLSILVKSDLKVEDGQIVLTKVEFVNLLTIIDLSKVMYIVNAINPLSFTTNMLDNQKTKVKINTVDIIGNKISVKGNILIPKNTISN